MCLEILWIKIVTGTGICSIRPEIRLFSVSGRISGKSNPVSGRVSGASLITITKTNMIYTVGLLPKNGAEMPERFSMHPALNSRPKKSHIKNAQHAL
jgi:hypothetical protein